MKFLVLEDTRERVTWLRNVVGGHADIVYSDNVLEFCELAEDLDPAEVAAVVFDHDLPLNVSKPKGTTFVTPKDLGDSNGLTGADAAKRVVTFDVPHLVWSCNDTGARTIRDNLRVRGVQDIEVVPFYENNYPAITRFIIRALKLYKVKNGV